jgi:hypothetical protein
MVFSTPLICAEAAGIDVVGKTDEHRREADHAVHQRDQFGHLRHLDGACRINTDARADHHGSNDPRVTGAADVRAEDRRQNGDGHADDTVQIAAPGGFRIAQAAEAENEKDGCSEIGDRCQAFRHDHRLPICGTSPACAGSRRSRRTC